MNSIIKTLQLGLASALFMSGAAAANSAFTQAQSVPTLDELGMVGLIVAIGLAAGWIVRNRGK